MSAEEHRLENGEEIIIDWTGGDGPLPLYSFTLTIGHLLARRAEAEEKRYREALSWYALCGPEMGAHAKEALRSIS